MTAEIQVYALFPRVVAIGSDLNLDSANWQWVFCLALPLDMLDALQFSLRPYKWIRYAIGTVIGAEGNLSFTPDSLNIVDYTAGLPIDSTALYYHISDDERRKMFPFDPNIGRTNITSSIATTRRARFRSDVAARDGNQCVLTGIPGLCCDAVHLLAHSKGDMYISMYTQRRSRDSDGGDFIQAIDSIRNGLFLNKFTHVGVGKHIAFLPSPNFAMDTSDIDQTAPAGEKRCTAHLFDPTLGCLFGGRVENPSPTPLRISDTADWPPGILFDAVYASTVLHHFGTQELKDQVAATWIEAFYLNEFVNQSPAEREATLNEQATTAERARERALERQRRCEPDTFDMLLALPYILVPPNELQATLREAREKAAAAEQKRVQEKVEAWNREVDAS